MIGYKVIVRKYITFLYIRNKLLVKDLKINSIQA